MFYNYAELEDGTQLAFSNVLDSGEVQVSIERPVELGFDSAMRTLPAFEWSEIEGFDDVDIDRPGSFVHNNTQLILRLAREMSGEYAQALPLSGTRDFLLDGRGWRARARLCGERPSHRRGNHCSLAVLDLRHDARRFEPQCVGGGDHIASAVGALGRHAGAIAHRLEHARHQTLHVFPAELAHAVLDEWLDRFLAVLAITV